MAEGRLQFPRNEILIFGHSFVRRLGEQCNRFTPSWRNLGLNTADFNVWFHSVSGATVPRLYHESSVVIDMSPHTLILQIGGNDLNNPNVNPYHLAQQIIDLSTHLLSLCHSLSQVYICKLHFRHQGNSHRLLRHNYNRDVSLVNNRLVELQSRADCIIVWSHRGMCLNWQSQRLQDGIHLNKKGMQQYYRSIRGAVLSAHKPSKVLLISSFKTNVS